MASLLLPVIYLAFISLGLPDSLLGSAWPSMVGQLGADLSWAGIVSMIISARHHRFQPVQRASQRPPRHRRRHGGQRAADRSGAVRVFHLHPVLAAVRVGGALRPGRRQRGRGAERLCLAALQKPPHELAALHVGRGRQRGARHHGPGAGRRQLAGRLPHHLADPVRPDGGAAFEPAAVETPRKKRRRAQTIPRSTRTLPQLLRMPGVPQVLLCFFCYCALESTAGMWAASYCTLVRGIDAGTAAGWASTFYLGITIGRGRPAAF